MHQSTRFFIIGTDTGAGKTILSLILMQYFYKQGKTPFYLKPLQTGCKDPHDTDSDAKFIYNHVPQLKGKDPADAIIYCYKNPKAPYFAAKDEGSLGEIDPAHITHVVDEKSKNSDPLIIEAAGGLLVPVTETLLMVDMIQIVHATPIIAARAGLGTINHTLLTIEALKARALGPGGIVLLESPVNPTPPDMIQENIKAIEKISGVQVAGVIPLIKDFHKVPSEIQYTVQNMLHSNL